MSKIASLKKSTLIKGDASENIFQSNSFDLTITLHSIEPNGDAQGEMMLKNVINTSSKYILLFEPDYSAAPDLMKKRMKTNGYVCNIQKTIDKMSSVTVIEKFLLEIQENKDNLTTCWILKKNNSDISFGPKLVCPYSGDALMDFENIKHSAESGLVYPIVDNIMFINKSDAIFIGGKDLENFRN